MQYQCVGMEDYAYPPGAFDVVISSLAFHYTQDIGALFGKIYASLAPGGVFVFSVEHPVFTAYGTQSWYCDDAGNHLHWPVDRYFQEGKREAVFLGEKVTKYHHTLTGYVDAVTGNGFALCALKEPMPAPHLMGLPEMQDEMRRPMMLLISCTKPAGN